MKKQIFSSSMTNCFFPLIKVVSVMLSCLMLSSIVVAETEPLVSEPHQLVDETTNKVLAILEDGVDPIGRTDEFIAQLSTVLDPVIAFDYISRGVMGAYAKKATPEQRRQFSGAFKRGLVNTYGKGIAGFSELDIVVLPPKTPIGDANRVNVIQEIRSANGVSKVAYSMRRTRSNRWKIVNIIINGINFGQTFRGQFAATVEKNEGDLEKTIAEWGDSLGTVR